MDATPQNTRIQNHLMEFPSSFHRMEIILFSDNKNILCALKNPGYFQQ